MVTAAVCAVVAGYRSYTAIAEWVADVPAATALALGMTPDQRPSEAMIRRLLQALDPQLLTAAIGVWLASRTATAASTTPQAIAVDGKTLRGSRTTDTAARHVMTACDQTTGVVLAGIDVDGHTRFQPLLDQINDLRDTVITADALHCQREHVTYLAERGAHWILDPDRQRQPAPPTHPAHHAGPGGQSPTPPTTPTADTAAARSAAARSSRSPPASTSPTPPKPSRSAAADAAWTSRNASPPKPSTPSPTYACTRRDRHNWPVRPGRTGRSTPGCKNLPHGTTAKPDRVQRRRPVGQPPQAQRPRHARRPRLPGQPAVIGLGLGHQRDRGLAPTGPAARLGGA
nr:ISAs1 family transposase [Micromonospora sp. KC207]